MVHLDILRDNREQNGWDFENYDVTVHGETVDTGDYTLAEFCDHDGDLDTYYPTYAVERKGPQDFISSITYDRDRFLAEVKRASDWEAPLLVLVEEPRTTYRRKRKFMQHRDVAPSQIFGTVSNWEKYYNVKFEFVGTRERAQQQAFAALSARLRAVLTTGD